jgi:MFS family permease
LQMLQDPKAYLLALVYFFLLGATYTMVFWVPTLIQSWGVKDLFLVGIYAGIPNAAGIIGMILIGRHSDNWHERRWHFAVCVAIAAVGLFITTLLQGNLIGSILALSVAVIGIASATPLFFALTSEYLSAGSAAGGLALISSLGNLGPAVSPSINGLILRSTGDNIYKHTLRDGTVRAVRSASIADDASSLGQRSTGGRARALTDTWCTNTCV